MRVGTGLCLLISCAVLAGCTAAAPKGPDTTVTAPVIGRPAPPDSAQAALERDAFTPYADLGANASDGLAPGDTYAALHTACMNDAGYGQYADSALFTTSDPAASALTLALPFGWFGYLGAAEAAQYGFMVSNQFLGPAINLSDKPFAGLPVGAQAAAGKCFNIVTDFNNAQIATSMAGMATMGDAIINDVVQDPNLKNATKAWSACMARNGYAAPDANTLAFGELRALDAGPSASGSSPTAAQNKAQIAMAVADADCTHATDLAGIYFAVQGSYEQQVVDANQQALNTAVREYKASYARELNKLPALLRTTSPGLRQASARPGGTAHAGVPTPTRS